MRFLKSIFLLFILSIIVVSCQKEMSAENGYLPGSTGTGSAAYALDGAPGACTTPVISGTYTVGAALNASNTVKINANVTTIGTYTITTATTNGIKFSASGSFTAVGVQQVSLTGSGTPTVSGPFNFNAGSNGCSFLITVVVPAPPAVGTLDCATASLGGVYTQSIALSASNMVTIPVNVTTAGAYSITTVVTNGVTFSGSGNLVLGAQSIVLSGSGTPTNAGATSFPVSLGSSNCSFSITFLPAPPPAVGVLDCASIVVNGVYTQGIALTSSNTVSIGVNVTTAGLYTITSTANGVTFSGSGVVAAGAQTIVLTGTGTPAAAGAFTFNVSLGASTCSFSITFIAGSTDFLKCSIDGGAIINFNNLSGSLIPGFFSVSGDSGGQTLDIGVSDTGGGNIVTGTYHNLSLTNTSIYCNDQLTIGSTTWVDIDAMASSNIFTVNITSITPTTVTGTFNGKLTDIAGGGTSTKMITNGSFSITY